jgi:hypothetical protein
VDLLATASEIAALLQVAEAVPQLPQRHASQKERREAYLEHQRQAYKLMATISHLSFLGQVETDTYSWRTTAFTVFPGISPCVDFALSDEGMKGAFVRSIFESLRGAAGVAKAMSQNAPIYAAVVQGENQLRDQVIIFLGKMFDTLAGYLTALAEVQRVGRPGPVRASRAVNELLVELLLSIGEQDDRPLLVRLVLRRKSKKSDSLHTFDNCRTALVKANAQFMSEAQADKLDRLHEWQAWRGNSKSVLSAKELLLGASGRQ